MEEGEEEGKNGGMDEREREGGRDGWTNGRRIQLATITQHKVTCFLSLPRLGLNPVERHIATQLFGNAASHI